MNRKSLIALLENRENLSWEERSIDNSNVRVRWIQFLGYKHHKFGLSEDGIQIAEYSDLRLTQEDYYIAFVSLLELERSKAVDLIKTALESVELPENVIRTFPFDEIMLTALRVSDHWGNLAKSWLESGYPISPNIALEFPGLKQVVRWQNNRMEQIINA